jgi:NCS1 family nucleobase:cation symporter-1
MGQPAALPAREAGPASPLAVEVHAIDYIPRRERHGRPWHLGALWFVANAELISFATGPIGIHIGLNFAWTALAIVLGTLIGTLAMAFHSAQGPRLGLAQMIQSRPQFGYFGALLPIVTALFVFVGYATFDTVLGGELFNTTIRTPVEFSFVLFIGLALALTAIGYDLIHRLSRYSSIIYLVNFGLFTVLAVASINLPAEQMSLSADTFQLGPFLIVMGVLMSYNLSWAPYVSDYSRYLPADTTVRSAFGWTYVGTALGAIWPAVLGALVGAAHPDLSPIAAIKTVADDAFFQGWGFWTLILSVPTLVIATTLSIYTAGLSTLAAIDVVRPVRSGLRTRIVTVSLVALLVLGLALLVANNFLGSYNAFLLIILYFLIPWTAINLVDYFLVRKGNYAIKEIFKPDGIYRRWGWQGLVSYWVAFVVMIPFFSTTIFTGFIAAELGGGDIAPFVGFPLAGILYYVLTRNLDVDAEAGLAEQQLAELEGEAARSPVGQTTTS